MPKSWEVIVKRVVIVGIWAATVSVGQGQQARPAPIPKRVARPVAAKAAGRVTGARLQAYPARWTGACPGKINFRGAITANGPAQVRYTWKSFDGGTWPQGTLNFASAGTKQVSEHWEVGSAGKVTNGWLQLQVLSPNPAYSSPARFQVSCGVVSAGASRATAGRAPQTGLAAAGRVTQVHVSDSPANYMGPCPGKIRFVGRVSTSGPARVQYLWVWSDGSTGPAGVLNFARAGSQMASFVWTLGAKGPGWGALKITSPQRMESNRAPFNMRCK